MDPIESEIKEVVDGLFRRLRQVPVEPPPFLGTRVFAELRQRARRPGWLAWSSTLVGILAVATLVFVLMAEPRYEAFVAQPFLVKIELKSLQLRNVKLAEIVLPDGVRFPLPGLDREKRLRLAWKAGDDRPFFSFVLKGDKVGMKKVVVRFRDERDRVVAERRLHIRMRGATSIRYARWTAPATRADEVVPGASREEMDAFERAVAEGHRPSQGH